MEKHSVSRLSCLFAHLHLFFLTLSLLWSSLFYSSLLSDSSHLCFSVIHIVGSMAAKLPSMNSHLQECHDFRMFMATLIAGRADFLYSPSEADSDIEAVIGPVHCTGPGLLFALHHKCLPVVLCVRYTQATYKRKIFAHFWLRWWLDALERKFEHAATRLHGRNMPANIVTIPSCRFLTNAEKLASFGEAMFECGTQATVTSRALFCQQPKFHDGFWYACWWCKARIAIFCVLPCCANDLGWLRAAPASNGVPHCRRLHPQSIHGVASNEARNPPSGQILGPGAWMWCIYIMSLSKTIAHGTAVKTLTSAFGFPLSRCTEAHWRLSDVWTSTCKEALFLNGCWTCLLLAMHSFCFPQQSIASNQQTTLGTAGFQQLWLLCVAKPCLWRSPVYVNQWHWPRKRSLTA